MKFRILLQSRTNSRRLPGKSLLPIGNIAQAILCAKRLRGKSNDLILVTSKDSTDDAISNLAKKNNIKTYRGEMQNVLSRFYQATLDLRPTDVVVRATADNLVPDVYFLKKCFNIFKKKKLKYLYCKSPENELPYGLSLEFFFVKHLRKAFFKAKTKFDKEHVTPWLRRNIKNKKNLLSKDLGLGKLGYLNCSIDLLDEYIKMEKVFGSFQESPEKIYWLKLIHRLEQFEKLKLSKIGIGTANFGTKYGIKKKKIKIKIIKKILNSAKRRGINFVDTAHAYGDAEKKIGKFKFIIFSKLDPMINLNKKSNNKIKEMVASSIFDTLKSINKKQIDVLLLHRWKHYYLKKGLIWKELNKFKKLGLIKSLGASVVNLKEASEALNETKIQHLQIPFNILDKKWLNLKFQKLLEKRPDVKIYARSIFLQGLLLSEYAFWPKWVNSKEIIKKIEKLKIKLNLTSNLELCLRYVLSMNWISHLIVGVDNVNQLNQVLEISKKHKFSNDMIKFIQKTFDKIPDKLVSPYKW